MKKSIKMIATAVIFTMLAVVALALVACQGGATPNGTLPNVTKGYFEGNEVASSFTINLSDYVLAHGTVLTYTASSNYTDVVTVSVEGTYLTATVHKGNGTATIYVVVYSNEKKAFDTSFTITATTYRRVACIGDSLTYGHTWHDQSYPVYLQKLLGNKIEVGNFGVNGSAVTNRNEPTYNLKYDTLQEYRDSLAFEPDIVLIMLGSNDGYNWTGSDPTFDEEYAKLINSYIDGGVEHIVLLTSPPTLTNNAFNISDEIIRDSVCPRQRTIAEEFSLPLVDVREAFETLDDYNSMFRPGDGVHFSVAGAQLVAQLVADAIFAL